MSSARTSLSTLDFSRRVSPTTRMWITAQSQRLTSLTTLSLPRFDIAIRADVEPRAEIALPAW
jgi:hypothetical protein